MSLSFSNSNNPRYAVVYVHFRPPPHLAAVPGRSGPGLGSSLRYYVAPVCLVEQSCRATTKSRAYRAQEMHMSTGLKTNSNVEIAAEPECVNSDDSEECADRNVATICAIAIPAVGLSVASARHNHAGAIHRMGDSRVCAIARAAHNRQAGVSS
jgi:hypothetical protein